MLITPEVKEFAGFKVEVEEIALLTFNHPKANVFSTPVLNDFIKAVEDLTESKRARSLVITGEGNTFLAGADIKEMSAFSPVEAEAFARLFHRAMDTIERFPRPVIAAVNGFALGGGCELILACDIVIASGSAAFAQPEINLGIIPGAGGTQRLASRIGKLKARELIFTGRRVSAEEALTLGLINNVVPKERLMEEAMAVARAIAKKPVQCLEASKSLINSGSFEREIQEFSRLFSYEDRKRLMDEFLNKKK